MLLFAALALAGEPVVEGGRVSLDGKTVVDLGTSSPRAVLQHADRLYVLTATGELQTWSVAAEPVLLARVSGPDATALFLVEGQVWVAVRETKAVPLGQFAPARGGERLPTDGAVTVGAETAGTSPAVAIAPPAKSAGTVVRVDRGVAVIDRGRASGLTTGSEIRFFGKETVRTPSLDGKGEELREVERVVATGRVRVTEDARALVDLARGGRVDVGDIIEVREGAYRYPVAPERLGGVWEAGVVVRPVLALDTVGVAFINDAWLNLNFEQPWYLQARLSPLAFGWSADGNPISVAGVLSGGYDSRYFSVGLGAGGSMLNGEPGTTQYNEAAVDGGFGSESQFKDVDGAFAVVQEARLGARDGLSISVRNTFLLVPITTVTYEYDKTTGDYVYDEDGNPTYKETSRDQFVYGGLAMRVNVPTGDRTDLFGNWSFGEAGEIVVEGGVSTWVRGNGDKGSIGVQVGAGYGFIEGQPDDEYVVLSGPMVSIGGRYRF